MRRRSRALSPSVILAVIIVAARLSPCAAPIRLRLGEQFFTHADGTPRPLPRTSERPHDGMPVPEPLPELTVAFRPTPRRWQVQDWGASNGNQNLNRIGGAGSWIQDAIYPQCPACARTMPLIAQLDAATPIEGSPGWEQWAEGIIYAFWCRDCRISAVTSQQT